MFAHLMLIKLTTCVNFINISCAIFLPIFWPQKISNPKHSFVVFGAKISTQNARVDELDTLMTNPDSSVNQMQFCF